MILFVSGYFYGYMFSSAWRRDLRFVVFLVVVVAPLSGAIGGAIPFYINMHPSMVDTLLVAGTYFVFFLVNAALDILPALLKGRNQIVRNIGIIATILAILAQEVSPTSAQPAQHPDHEAVIGTHQLILRLVRNWVARGHASCYHEIAEKDSACYRILLAVAQRSHAWRPSLSGRYRRLL